jgi:hypothetical protein
MIIDIDGMIKFWGKRATAAVRAPKFQHWLL